MNITTELRKLDRSLSERREFLRRLNLAELVWVNQFEQTEQEYAKTTWQEVRGFCEITLRPFTYLIADIIEGNEFNFPFLLMNSDKLLTVAEYIAYGNASIEMILPEQAKQTAIIKSNKVISKHIMNKY